MPAPKPGGAKRVGGGGAKRAGGGGAKGGAKGAKKGGGAKAGGAKPKPKGRSIGGGISVNTRNSHLVGRESISLIKPLNSQYSRGLSQRLSKEEIMRNPGVLSRDNLAGPSSGGGLMRGLSVATDRMALDRSMTNIFMACEDNSNANFSNRNLPHNTNNSTNLLKKFDGSSMNLSRKPKPTPSPVNRSKSPASTTLGKNLQSNQREKIQSRSHMDLTTLGKNSKEADPLLKIVKVMKKSILSPIISLESVTSSKNKHCDQEK